MPTPAEQKALAFVAIVVLLGGAVRVVRGSAPSSPTATAGEQQSLARQTFSASSSAAAVGQSGKRKGKTEQRAPKRRYAGAKFDSTGVLIEGSGVVSTTGFPPPSARIDTDARGGQVAGGADAPPASGARRIDMDIATAEEIERLPRVGPSLARRIVANRDSLGPFGALSGLRRVKGMGPATIERLEHLVTFSGQTRR